MFTGIIETMARIENLRKEGGNLHITLSSTVTPELKIDQSVAHNGVCLTVINISESNYTVTAIDETLRRSNLGDSRTGDMINIERCMPVNGRFDGHIVQGHVDTTAVCTAISEQNGSWEFRFEHPEKKEFVTVEKGSVTVNGVSLTVGASYNNGFSVFIIPYTYEHTNFKNLKKGDRVNLEFDIVGKYVAKLMAK